MKNYEDMSDSQIAQKVFFFVSGNLCPKGGLAHIGSDGFFFFDEKNINRKFDPCNNPADAWPIIVQSGISLIKCTVGSWCWSAEIITDIDEATDNLFQCQSSFDYQDANPLRSAMIVFLKMNEDKL